MVTRRRLLLGSAAALGAGIALVRTADASVTQTEPGQERAGLGSAVFGMPLPDGNAAPVMYKSRAAWGADESFRFSGDVEIWPADCHPVQALTVHHSASANNDPDPAARVRAIYHSQAVNQGWGDIGYHLLIDAAGVVYEGRWTGPDEHPVFGPYDSAPDLLINTAGHALSFNPGNIGICLLGDFTAVTPTSAAQDALVNVLASLAGLCGVDPFGVVNYVNPVKPENARTVRGMSGHRDWNVTACPGNAFYPFLDDVRTRTVALLPPIPRQREQTDSSVPRPGDARTPPPTPNPPATSGSGGRTRP